MWLIQNYQAVLAEKIFLHVIFWPCIFNQITIFAGKYWVDPNAGDIRDAILVRCEMETRSTCILPMPSQTKQISGNGNTDDVWLSEMDKGMKVNNILIIII